MQNNDKAEVSWVVEFKQEHKNCCPPRSAWIVRKETVKAESAEQAQQIVENAWKYNKKIVVTNITELKHEN